MYIQDIDIVVISTMISPAYSYNWYTDTSYLGVQKRRDLLAKVFNNGVGAALDLETLGDSVQLDVGLDRPGNGVDLVGLLGGPHGGAELQRKLDTSHHNRSRFTPHCRGSSNEENVPGHRACAA